MILFIDYQAIVVQHNMMGKRKGCSVEYCRYVYATAHKLVDKRSAWWLQWPYWPTYELRWNTEGWAGEHSTKERKRAVAIKEQRNGNILFANKLLDS